MATTTTTPSPTTDGSKISPPNGSITTPSPSPYLNCQAVTMAPPPHSESPQPSRWRPISCLPFSLARKPARRTLILAAVGGVIALLAVVLVPTVVVTTQRARAAAAAKADPPGRLGAGSGGFVSSISHYESEYVGDGREGPAVGDKVQKRREDGEGEAEDGTPRKISTTLFYPIIKDHCTQTCSVPYMPPETALWANQFFIGYKEAGVFDNITYAACCRTGVPLDPFKETLVVIEPQVGISRFLYGGIALEIASHGFVVLLVDHDDVESSLDPFQPLTEWNNTVDTIIQRRVDDVDFLLAQLGKEDIVESFLPKSNFTLYSKTFNTDAKSGVIGHGIGGSLAIELLKSRFSKFNIAIDLAGTPPLLTSPITQGQLVYFGVLDPATGTNITRPSDIHWPRSWPYLQSGKSTAWTLMGGNMFDLTDMPIIASLAEGVSGKAVKARGLGGIERWKAFGAVAQMVRAYCVVGLRDGDGGRGPDGHEGGGMVTGLRQLFAGEMVPFLSS